jgi:hypothetical protein
LGLSREQLQ